MRTTKIVVNFLVHPCTHHISQNYTRNIKTVHASVMPKQFLQQLALKQP